MKHLYRGMLRYRICRSLNSSYALILDFEDDISGVLTKMELCCFQSKKMQLWWRFLEKPSLLQQ